jgi:pyruvate,water dikinase
VVVAGERPFVDVTAVLRDPIGRAFLERVSAIGEARSSVVFTKLGSDPRFAASRGRRVRSLRRILPVILRSGIPVRVLRLWLSPDRSRTSLIRNIEQGTRVHIAASATASQRLDAVEEFMRVIPPFVFPRLLPAVVAAMLSYLAVGRLLGGRARPEELMKLSRRLPNNPTTEMDLALWGLTKHIRADAASRQVLTSRTDVELAEAYRVGQLPAVLQTGLSAFLDRYGFRSVGRDRPRGGALV